MDDDPGCVAGFFGKGCDLSEWGQRSRCGRAKFETGRCAVAGRNFEPNEEFEPSDACLFGGGRSEGDAVPEGKQFVQEISVDMPGSVAAYFFGCRKK